MAIFAVSIFSLVALSYGFNINPRIINGDLSKAEDFPFYVSLDGEVTTCGATLLSDRWILTAAHCLERYHEIVAYFGIISAKEYSKKAVLPMSNQYMHPLYNATTIVHDIGLIELSKPITFNEHIQPAQLTSICDKPHIGGQTVIAAGTGKTTKDESWSRRSIRSAKFLTISSRVCTTKTVHKKDPDTIICAYENHRTQTTYTGDSGGPLVARSDGKLIGLLSSYVELTEREKTVLQVFINVSYYYDWIEQITGLKMPKCRRK